MRYASLLFAGVLAGCATTWVGPPGMSSDEVNRAQDECKSVASQAFGSDWDKRSLYERCLQDKGFRPG